MDIKLKPKPWYVKYRFFIVAGVAFVAVLAYAVAVSLAPRQVRVSDDDVTVAEAAEGKFLEYVDVEGVVQPILTLKVNATESGFVSEILREEGAMLRRGDTILVLTNPELMRTIDDEQDEWERQQRTYREQQIEQEQRTITLRQQTLDAEYEMQSLDKKLSIAREEFRMGVKSRAELDVAEEEYAYRRRKTELQMQSLRHDSVVGSLRQQLMQGDIERAGKKRSRTMQRTAGLVVTAPCDGQLSYLAATPGQQIASGSAVGEIKVLSQYKIHVVLNEYYIDRIATGQPASITHGGKDYALRVSRVVPEVKERSFSADLVFGELTGEERRKGKELTGVSRSYRELTDDTSANENDQQNIRPLTPANSPLTPANSPSLPDNIRIGKSYRVKIELGKAETALVIPRGDFYGITGGQWIYRLSPDGRTATKVPIAIGRQNPRQYEITSGLTVGDRVIVSGYDKFGDAERITIK